VRVSSRWIGAMDWVERYVSCLLLKL